MDLKGGSNSDGAVIQQWECIQDANAVNRQFNIERLTITTFEDKFVTSEDVILYPNPTHEALSVQLPEYVSTGWVSIHNVNGQRVLERTITGTEVLNLRDFPNGVYHVHVTIGTQSFSQTVVKN